MSSYVLEPCPLHDNVYHVIIDGNRTGMVFKKEGRWCACYFRKTLDCCNTIEKAVEVLQKKVIEFKNGKH